MTNENVYEVDECAGRRPLFYFPLLGRPVDGFLEELLNPASGGTLTVPEAMGRFGNLRVMRAALASAMRDRFRRPRLRGYPPRVFISYRWGDEKTKKWIGELANYLEARGLCVELDLYNQDKVGEHGLGIMHFVSCIANCKLFLPVITPEYAEGWLRTYIYEEVHLSNQLERVGLRKFPLWKSGESFPDCWRRVPA